MIFKPTKAIAIYNRIIYRLGFMIRFNFNENQRSYRRIHTDIAVHWSQYTHSYRHNHNHAFIHMHMEIE